MYALVKDNKVVSTKLPRSGVLSDGRTVSNYYLLPHEVLLSEGWLPLVDERPETDEYHRAVFSDYEIFSDHVEKIYTIEEIIPAVAFNTKTVSKAAELLQRHMAKSLIVAEELGKEELLDITPLFPVYEVGTAYKVGSIFTYKRSLYEVIQDHTSQEDWPPDATPSLYKDHIPKGEIEDWRQPLGAHDAYMTGDRVLFNGKTYISKIDNNVWEPGVYGWDIYTE